MPGAGSRVPGCGELARDSAGGSSGPGRTSCCSGAGPGEGKPPGSGPAAVFWRWGGPPRRQPARVAPSLACPRGGGDTVHVAIGAADSRPPGQRLLPGDTDMNPHGSRLGPPCCSTSGPRRPAANRQPVIPTGHYLRGCRDYRSHKVIDRMAVNGAKSRRSPNICFSVQTLATKYARSDHPAMRGHDRGEPEGARWAPVRGAMIGNIGSGVGSDAVAGGVAGPVREVSFPVPGRNGPRTGPGSCACAAGRRSASGQWPRSWP